MTDSIAPKYGLNIIGLDKTDAVNRMKDAQNGIDIIYDRTTSRKTYSKWLGQQVLTVPIGETGIYY